MGGGHADHNAVDPLEQEFEEYLAKAPACIAKLLRFADSGWGHFILFILLVIDVSIVVATGFLDSHYLTSQIDDCKAYISACTNATTSSHRRLGGLLPGRGEAEAAGAAAAPSRLLASSAGSSGTSTCSSSPHFGDHTTHYVEVYLAYCSMVILSIFLIEQILRIIVSRGRYFKKPLHVLDFIVVGLSLVLEILVTHLPLGGMLILGRIWRFARTGYTTVESLHEMHKVHPAVDSLGRGVVEAMWGRLSEDRWTELARHSHASTADLKMDEVALAVEIAQHSPEFVLNALALENERLRDQGLAIRKLETLTGRQLHQTPPETPA